MFVYSVQCTENAEGEGLGNEWVVGRVAVCIDYVVYRLRRYSTLHAALPRTYIHAVGATETETETERAGKWERGTNP